MIDELGGDVVLELDLADEVEDDVHGEEGEDPLVLEVVVPAYQVLYVVHVERAQRLRDLVQDVNEEDDDVEELPDGVAGRLDPDEDGPGAPLAPLDGRDLLLLLVLLQVQVVHDHRLVHFRVVALEFAVFYFVQVKIPIGPPHRLAEYIPVIVYLFFFFVRLQVF